MNKTTPKLPGTGMRILSFVPVVNCFVMIYLGISYADKLTLILGGAYFLISLEHKGTEVLCTIKQDLPGWCQT